MWIISFLFCVSGKYGGSKFDSKNDFDSIVNSSRLPRFDLGKSRSFEDSPEQRFSLFFYLVLLVELKKKYYT